MSSRSSTALLIAIVAIASGVGSLVIFLTELSIRDAVLIGGMVFAVCLVLAIYIYQNIALNNLRKRLHSNTQFESEILKKMERLEGTGITPSHFQQIEKRIEVLENFIIESDLDFGKTTDAQAESVAFNPAKFEDENVVQLVTGSSKASERVAKQQHKTKLKRIFREQLHNANIQIRLQPIVNLHSRKVLAVDAGQWLIGEDDKPISIRENEALLDAKNQRALNSMLVNDLGGVVRMMVDDEQVMPIFCEFYSQYKSAGNDMGEYLDAIKGDTLLTQNLVSVICGAQLSKNPDTLAPMIVQFKEAGIRLAIKATDNLNEMARLVEKIRPDFYLIESRSLLAYQTGSKRRVAERLLSSIANDQTQIIATALDTREQAAALLDVDISAVMGELISPARSIRLYKAPAGSVAAKDHN